jgi:hypothetical protein
MFNPSDSITAKRERDAEKQRQYRERRKRGEREFRLILNEKKIANAICARDGLPPGWHVPQRTIEKILRRWIIEAADHWLDFRRAR